MDLENDIESCLAALYRGGLILYPTDTIWGIGCDATNPRAVERIYRLKQRDDSKAMIILVEGQNQLLHYAADPGQKVFDHLSAATKPTTLICDHAMNLAGNLPAADGSIAIRIVKDEFCRTLINRFKKPIVSTSANISGASFPKNFSEIGDEIKNGVDYIVQHRQNDLMSSVPSTIIRLKNGEIEIIRS